MDGRKSVQNTRESWRKRECTKQKRKRLAESVQNVSNR
jgi:hypothetical protein